MRQELQRDREQIEIRLEQMERRLTWRILGVVLVPILVTLLPIAGLIVVAILQQLNLMPS